MDPEQLHRFAQRWRRRAEDARTEDERQDCARLAERYDSLIGLTEAGRPASLRLDIGC